jgi:hypothetical protein
MKEKGESTKLDFIKRLSLLEKRGTCIYIRAVISQAVFRLVKKNMKIARRNEDKLTDELSDEVTRYVYYEITNQVWEFHEGQLQEDDAQNLLDHITMCFCHTFPRLDINDLIAKLDEYKEAKEVSNQYERFSRNLLDIVGTDDITLFAEITLLVADMIAHFCTVEIRQQFEISEELTEETIRDFWANYFHARDMEYMKRMTKEFFLAYTVTSKKRAELQNPNIG